MKSVGTGSVLTIAPALLSLLPVIGYFFSCIAVRISTCISGFRVAISSINKTPPFALWIAPAITLSCGGVPNPPVWKGSCKTSPRNAPSCRPVASTKGA